MHRRRRLAPRIRLRRRQAAAEEERGFALELANRQLAASGLETYACPADATIADCTRPLVDSTNSIAYKVFTEYMAHSDSLCFHLHSAAFEERSAAVVNSLYESSRDASDRMRALAGQAATLADETAAAREEHAAAARLAAELVDGQRTARVELTALQQQQAAAFDEASSALSALHASSRDALLDVRRDAETIGAKQRDVEGLLDRLLLVQRFLVGELGAIQTALVYLAALVCAALVTSVPLLSLARPALFLALACTCVLEAAVTRIADLLGASAEAAWGWRVATRRLGGWAMVGVAVVRAIDWLRRPPAPPKGRHVRLSARGRAVPPALGATTPAAGLHRLAAASSASASAEAEAAVDIATQRLAGAIGARRERAWIRHLRRQDYIPFDPSPPPDGREDEETASETPTTTADATDAPQDLVTEAEAAAAPTSSSPTPTASAASPVSPSPSSLMDMDDESAAAEDERAAAPSLGGGGGDEGATMSVLTPHQQPLPPPRQQEQLLSPHRARVPDEPQGKMRRRRTAAQKAPAATDENRAQHASPAAAMPPSPEPRTMRSGRLSMPVVEYWANRRIERSADGSYAQSETGGVMASLEAVDYTGSFRSERPGRRTRRPPPTRNLSSSVAR